MTNNIRVFLWLGLALALWLNYTQWQMDYGPKPTPATAQTGSSSSPNAIEEDDTVPQAAQPATAPAPACQPEPLAEAGGPGRIRTYNLAVMSGRLYR